MPPNNRLVLVDGYAQLYRGFHAVRGLTNDRGEPTNALFAFARFLMALDREFSPAFAAVVLDKGAPQQRLDILPEYKATRAPMPDDLRAQIPLVRDWILASGWHVLEEEGLEADDIIAAVVGAREGRETFIVSHDKDLAQLVSADGVCQLTPAGKARGGGLTRLGPAEVRQRFGVGPEAIVDYLALVGDSVDNIPGVPGVGAKTAAGLLTEFGSIEGLLANLDAIPREALRAKLAGSAELLSRNRRLVALQRQLPTSWTGVQGIARRQPEWERLTAIARDNQLKSLLTALEQARGATRSPTLFDLGI